MKLYAGICGGFPRPPKLRKAIDDLNEGKLSRREFEEVFNKSMEEVVALQESSGLDIITSGLLLWHDLLRPFAEKLSGIKLNGLFRFYDNNFYYRRSIIVNPIKRSSPITLDEVSKLREVAHRRIKAVMPGPFTFKKLSQNSFYSSGDVLERDLIEAFGAEVEDLSKVVDLIQLDEPSLVDVELSLDELKKGVDLVNAMLNSVSVPRERILVATYFYLDPKAFSVLSQLNAGLHVDLVSYGRSAYEALEINEFLGPSLSLGVIDSRSIFPENPDEILDKVSALIEKVSADLLIFSTNAWLDFLPFEEAIKKLNVLGAILNKARGEMR